MIKETPAELIVTSRGYGKRELARAKIESVGLCEMLGAADEEIVSAVREYASGMADHYESELNRLRRTARLRTGSR